MSLKQAFKTVLRLQERSVIYHDISAGTKTDIKVVPSNYFRNLANLEDTVSIGREFVMDKDQLSVVPKRGDKIIDSDIGVATIKETREMFAMGEIIGYRLRTE